MSVSGEVFLAIERYAHGLEQAAGYGGRLDDGGAGQLRDRVRFYKMGRDGVFPSAAAKAFRATTFVAVWISLIAYSFTMPTPHMFLAVVFLPLAPLGLYLVYSYFYSIFE
jgi:hypothetical protein